MIVNAGESEFIFTVHVEDREGVEIPSLLNWNSKTNKGKMLMQSMEQFVMPTVKILETHSDYDKPIVAEVYSEGAKLKFHKIDEFLILTLCMRYKKEPEKYIEMLKQHLQKKVSHEEMEKAVWEIIGESQ